METTDSKVKKVPGFGNRKFQEVAESDEALFSSTEDALEWVKEHGDSVFKDEARGLVISLLEADTEEDRDEGEAILDCAILAQIAWLEYFPTWSAAGKFNQLKRATDAVRDASLSEVEHEMACQELIEENELVSSSKKIKSIPTPTRKKPSADDGELYESLSKMVEERMEHPCFSGVVECVEAQDLLILAGEITDRKPLGWIIDALNTPETEMVQRANMIQNAARVFDGVVKSIESKKRVEAGLGEIDIAMKFAIEVLRWAEGGWEATLQSFTREMRGVNPKTIEVLGFTEAQVTLTELVEGKPQWSVLSLYDVAYRVTSDEAVLQNRAFRRAALSGFASFFRFAFGQTGSEDQELLDWADEIATTLYGDDAKLTDRSRRNNAPSGAPKPVSAEVRAKKARRSEASKEVRRAMQQPKGAKPQTYGKK